MPDSNFTTAFDLLTRSNDPESIERGLSILRAAIYADPSNSSAHFAIAGAFDFLGREQEALTHYQRIVTLGVTTLPAQDQPALYIQLGSTLRNLQKFDEARKILEEGIERFPGIAAMKAFLGLNEFADGNYQKAAMLFLESSLREPGDQSVNYYSRALRHYASRLTFLGGALE
jgi:tetratricopeptide (TPR) repeat protein